LIPVRPAIRLRPLGYGVMSPQGGDQAEALAKAGSPRHFLFGTH